MTPFRSQACAPLGAKNPQIGCVYEVRDPVTLGPFSAVTRSPAFFSRACVRKNTCIDTRQPFLARAPHHGSSFHGVLHYSGQRWHQAPFPCPNDHGGGSPLILRASSESKRRPFIIIIPGKRRRISSSSQDSAAGGFCVAAYLPLNQRTNTQAINPTPRRRVSAPSRSNGPEREDVHDRLPPHRVCTQDSTRVEQQREKKILRFWGRRQALDQTDGLPFTTAGRTAR